MPRRPGYIGGRVPSRLASASRIPRAYAKRNTAKERLLAQAAKRFVRRADALCELAELVLMKFLGVAVRLVLLIALVASGLVAVVVWLFPELLNHL